MAKTIAVTGKGGTGKTLVSALIIRYLKKHATGPILALDADPDANLATVLGIPVAETVGDLREETLKEIKDFPAGMSKSSYIEAGLHQIIVEAQNVDIITMGRSEGPGCYCYINSLLRKFADDLQTSYDWVVMDNEAGLEHLSRRTASRVDHLLVVVNGSQLAIDCAGRIEKLVADIRNDVRNKYLLINDVVDEKRVGILREKTKHLDFEYMGCVPHDDLLEEALFNGVSVFDIDNTPAVATMDELMIRMEE